MERPTSRVLFSSDPAHCARQLQQHPYYRFAREMRQLRLRDPYCPRFHFSAPEGQMNDPNGLCFWQGRWHLFYQAFPPEAEIHWGHAVSTDLLHWQDLSYAIYPGPEQACWSGATLVEEDRVIALFFGQVYGNIVAVSSDPLLLNWEKIGCIRNIPGGKYDVYDPCIWKEGKMYYSLSGRAVPGVGTHGRRVEYLFRSADLMQWEYVQALMLDDCGHEPGDDGACPYFWPMQNGKHLLLHFSHMRGAQYVVGNWDVAQLKFQPIRGGSLQGYLNSSNLGGLHAPSACPDGRGNVVAVFNQTQGGR